LTPRSEKVLRCAAPIVLIPAALFQLRHGLNPPKDFGIDFQWAGARMLAHHIDPWALELRGGSVRHLSPPNYLHELYLLLMPLTRFSFTTAMRIWQAITLGLSVGIVTLLCRIYNVSRWGGLIFLLMLWASNPFRVTLALGQQSILELFLFCLFFQLRSVPAKGLVLGLSYAKYSFSPILVFCLGLERRFKLLALSVILPLAGYLAALLLLHTGPIRLAIEPPLTSREHVCSGFADVMTLSDRLLSGNHSEGGCEEAASPLSYYLAIAGSLFSAWWLVRRKLDDRASMALLAMLPLLLFRHLVYDYVFLLVPLIHVVKLATARGRACASGFRVRQMRLAETTTCLMVFLFWYLYRLAGLVKTPRQPLALLLIDMTLLALSIFTVGREAQ